ncbi:MAG: aryl-sulfate sulfotransferase [Piscinibacter sp.]|nr:aryl-sulfate sulfotransferase [Piscinibacter sp.]
MKSCNLAWRIWLVVSTAALLLCGCGGGSETTPPPPLASSSDVAIAGDQQGVSPFISFVQLRGESLAKVAAVRYTIQPKVGAVSKPVDVQYTIDALRRRGFAAPTGGVVTLPVFGLYAGYTNKVAVILQFEDKSRQTLQVDVLTSAFTDPNGIYDQPTILKARAEGSTLGFDFFFIKSGLGTPVVIDTDGEVRWVGVGPSNSLSSAFHDNAFVVGEQGSTKLYRLELDGSVSISFLISPTYTNFHHNIDPGKNGLLVEVDAMSGGVKSVESILADVAWSGAVLKEWDFAALLGAYMRSQGDDPSAFIRPGADWFHMNAATYDARDDSLIVSSRENFLIKVDYRSGNIIWVFGDPSKYWYTFPSLRAKALSLQGGGLYPIGQHATTITSDGLLMLFNDGLPSTQQPTGAPVGESRSYSAVSAYAIDPTTMTAVETWRFVHDQTILSNICSSAYEAAGKSLLVTYAVADNRTKARLVGLDADHNVVFDFEYKTSACFTSWNALPIPFEGLTFE